MLSGKVLLSVAFLMLIFYMSLHSLDFPPLLSSLCLPLLLAPSLTKMPDIHILGFFGEVQEC